MELQEFWAALVNCLAIFTAATIDKTIASERPSDSTTAGCGCHSGNIMQQMPKTLMDIKQGWASHRNAQSLKANIKL